MSVTEAEKRRAANAMLDALGCPTRRRILELLAMKPMYGAELVGHIGVRPSTVSHHLARLQRVGLLQSDWGFHAIDVGSIRLLQDHLENYLMADPSAPAPWGGPRTIEDYDDL